MSDVSSSGEAGGPRTGKAGTQYQVPHAELEDCSARREQGRARANPGEAARADFRGEWMMGIGTTGETRRFFCVNYPVCLMWSIPSETTKKAEPFAGLCLWNDVDTGY